MNFKVLWRANMFKLVLYDYLNNFKLNYLNKSFELSMFLFMVIYNIFNKMVIFDFTIIVLPIFISLCFLKKWNQIVEFMIDYESYNSYN